jgi:signal transduction histidine kinase
MGRQFPALEPLKRVWRELSLARKFVLAGGLSTLAAMLLCGTLTTTIMTDALMQHHSRAIAIALQAAIGQHVQDLEGNDASSGSSKDRLGSLTQTAPFVAQFPHLDVWGLNGELIFSNSPDVAHDKTLIPAPVVAALRGQVSAAFSDMQAAEFVAHGFKEDFIEIYFPLHSSLGGEIIAAAQVRETTTYLEQDLLRLTVSTWTAVAVSSGLALSLLYGVVKEGSLTIDQQRRSLMRRLVQSRKQLQRNRLLREEAQRLSRSITELTDEHLVNIGTDLHDGPAQSIGLAMIKLGQLRGTSERKKQSVVLDEVEAALGEASDDLRNIATGFVLPDIDELDLEGVIRQAVEHHTRRTAVRVKVEVMAEAFYPSRALGVCAYRFVQEGLNNALHHGLPDEVTVTAILEGTLLKLSVLNNYLPGSHSAHVNRAHGLGLAGLRARVHSIGGNFLFVQDSGRARIEMWLDMSEPPQQQHQELDQTRRRNA